MLRFESNKRRHDQHLLEQYAGMALQGLMSRDLLSGPATDYAQLALTAAQALVDALNAKKEGQ